MSFCPLLQTNFNCYNNNVNLCKAKTKMISMTSGQSRTRSKQLKLLRILYGYAGMIYPKRIYYLGAPTESSSPTEAVYHTYWITGIITVTTRKLKTLAMVLHPDKMGLVWVDCASECWHCGHRALDTLGLDWVGWASEWHCVLLALAEPKIERCCSVILHSVLFDVRLSG